MSATNTSTEPNKSAHPHLLTAKPFGPDEPEKRAIVEQITERLTQGAKASIETAAIRMVRLNGLTSPLNLRCNPDTVKEVAHKLAPILQAMLRARPGEDGVTPAALPGHSHRRT